MDWNTSVEQLALGELSPAEGAQVLRKGLAKDGPLIREELYLAVRSCVWKALDAHRRDPELNAWMEVIARAAPKLGKELEPKLRAFVELLQISSMAAEVERRRNPLESKHARRFLVILRASKGRMAKRALMERMKLKGSTLTQAMAPLIDRGLVARVTVGREVEYALTREGRAQINRLESTQSTPEARLAHLDLWKKYVKRAWSPHAQGLVIAYGVHEEQGTAMVVEKANSFSNAYALRVDQPEQVMMVETDRPKELVQ